MRLSKYKNIFPKGLALLNFDTNSALNTKLGEVENKIQDISKFVTNSALNRIIGEVENKIPNHYIYITTPECNRLENFAAG